MGVPISQIGPPIRMAIQNSIENKMEEIVTDHRDPTALWNQMNNFNLEIAKARLALEGPKRSGGFSSYIGRLNGHKVLIDGFDNMYDIQDE